MIRVSIFSNDFLLFDALGGWSGLVYIGQSINPEPSDQTDLNKRRRCILGGGGATDVEMETDRWPQGLGGL